MLPSRLVYSKFLVEHAFPYRQRHHPDGAERRLMKCHLCARRFEPEVESGETRCPKCNAKLIVKAARSKSPRVALGCPGCLRVLTSASEKVEPCRYCGIKIDPEIAKPLAKSLEGFEERAVSALLEGEAPGPFIQELEKAGAQKDSAFNFLDRLVSELPFRRHKLYKQLGRVTPPSQCDSCGLQTDLMPFEALWQLDTENTRYREDWGGFSGEFANLKNYDKEALYYICKNCQRLKPEKFAGGYPGSAGYLKKKFKKVKALL